MDERRTDLIRVMTYNLHGGRGLDGRRSFERQARVIADAHADIVAVQEISRYAEHCELDVLTESLGLEGRFVLAQTRPRSEYGHGLLVRGAFEHSETLVLPGHGSRKTEPRTAALHQVRVAGRSLRVVSTHLALTTLERDAQIRAILDTGWLEPPCLFLGDFNCTPRAAALAPLERARLVRSGTWRHRTWPTPLPLLPLDHVFVSSDLTIVHTEVIVRGEARWASDHAPLVADLRPR